MKSTIALTGLLLLIFSSLSLGDTSMDRIMSSLESGKITSSEAAHLLILSVVDNDQLPSEYAEGVEVDPCGTPALQEAFQLYQNLGEPVPGDSPLADRPVLSGPENIFSSPDGHFEIHWTSSGGDATTLGYVETVAEAADSSWLVQCDEMGYFVPPPDNGVGGNDLYDMYIKDLGAGLLGYCTSYGEYKPPDSTHLCSASHIVISKSISGSGQRKCTVAHEFQHAVQMSYDYGEQTWFMENCAVWMEDIVYPEVEDYFMYMHGGDNPIRKPWMDIRSGSMYWYGGNIWPRMMWLSFGEDAVREVWENCAAVIGANTFEAQEDMFADHGTTFDYFFMDYGCWRWFTAYNWWATCGMYDDDAQYWTPGPRLLHNYTILPAHGDQTTYEPDRFGIHWVKVDLASYQDGWVEMDFNGRDSYLWNMGIIMHNTVGEFYFEWHECDPSSGDITIGVDANGWDFVIFFPAFMSETSLDHTYEFDITYEAGIEGSPNRPGVIDLNVSSNPLRSGDLITFDISAAGRTRISVFDISGRLSATLVDEEMAAGSYSVQFSDSELADGTYFIVLFSNGQITSRKVVLTR